MRKPLFAWLIFVVCLAVVFSGIGWITHLVIQSGEAEAEATAQASREEKIRLALWRMDSAVAPVIGQENARPYFHYSSFYPAERAYGRMFSALSPGETLLPSPLLSADLPYVLLHFQIDSKGHCSSPQVPTGSFARLAARAGVDASRIALHQRRQSDMVRISSRLMLTQLTSARTNAPQAVRVDEPGGRRTVPVSPNREVAEQSEQVAKLPPVATGQIPESARQKAMSEKEFDSRMANQMMTNSVITQQQVAPPPTVPSATNLPSTSPTSQAAQTGPQARQGVERPAFVAGDGPLQAIWLGDALVLVRKIWVGESEYVQGCWLDWPDLRKNLLNSARDLLPDADLEPVRAVNPANDPGATLAALPVRIVPGRLPEVVDGRSSVLRLTLAFVWLCTLVAVAVVALVLRQAMVLSERRGAFVSAVTHELRTPLTTFRMYTEMLAEGMTPDAKDRQEFLVTLQREAERLDHLVRNVLAYARLEGNRTRATMEEVFVNELVERCQERLAHRLSEAGLELSAAIDPSAAMLRVRTDPAAVEQIVFNLVDNAAKYAASAATRTVSLTICLERGRLSVRIRDFGPGIPAKQLRRLFKPFSKSAVEAARTAPGVGLGLALSRRLARSLGGDLRLDASAKPGACFVLSLPLPR